MQIINSLLDTDFYTFTQQQVIFHKHTDVNVKYKFKWRNWHQTQLKISLKDFVNRIKEQVGLLCDLNFKQDELEYLNSNPYLKSDYIEYLRLFKLNKDHIKIYIENDQPQMEIEGPWLNTIPFETPVLSITSQLYSKHNSHTYSENEGKIKLYDKLAFLESQSLLNFIFSDFGTRRRYSFDWQKIVIQNILEYLEMKEYPFHFVGTSNVYFAKEFNITPMGTMSHQFLQAYQQLKGGNIEDSQKRALQDWADEYRGELGIALSDCLTFDFFLKDFDRYFASLFDGCRHDSGNPYDWCSKLIDHYKSIRINPSTKTALFSDGLNFKLAAELNLKYQNFINTAFGIGTNLTNDCGFPAPQIVIKMIECNGRPVAKVSDSPGKGMCEDQEYMTYLKSVIVKRIEKEI